MKKLLALTAAFITVFNFSACDKSAEPELDAMDVIEEIIFPDESAEPVDEDMFRVGVIYGGEIGDVQGDVEFNSYTYAHERGIVAMQNALGLADGQIVRKTGVSPDDEEAVEAALRECADEGCEIIFATEAGYASAARAAAKSMPDSVICVAAGDVSDENISSYSGKIYQAYYLSGIAAGMRTQTAMVGFISAMGESQSVSMECINAFAMGVEKGNPLARVYVRTAGEWANADAERLAADELIEAGCDVIAQHCGTIQPQIAAEERENVWSIGYGDMSEAAPTSFLAAPVWNWGIYYTMAAKSVMEGNWTGENYFASMSDGLIDIYTLTKNCADGTKDAIDEAKAQILGGWEIFSGEITDNMGNAVCSEGETLDLSVMDWYYGNVVIDD